MVMIRKLGSKIEFRCRLRKSLPRVSKKDYVLYALREFESKDVGDVILIYSSDEVHLLKKEKHIEEEIDIDELFSNDDANENVLKEDDEDINIDDL